MKKKLIFIIITIIVVAGVAFGFVKLLDVLTVKDTAKQTITTPLAPTDSTNTPPTKTDAAKDTTIQANLAVVQTNLKNYAASHAGKYPATPAEIAAFDAALTVKDPISDKPYTIGTSNSDTYVAVDYRPGYKCNIDSADPSGAIDSRGFTVQLKLTGGTTVCLDNL